MSHMKDAVIDAHNKYESMSVHDLLGVAVCTPFLSDEEIVAIESALRNAAVREASVGEISIEQHEGYMSPDPMFTVGTESALKAGEFYLVPKEKE